MSARGGGAQGEISGEVVVEAGQAPFDSAVLHLYLEEVGRADAPAVRVAESHIQVGAHRGGRNTRVPFSLPAPPPAAAGSFTLRAHLAPHGGQEVKPGDKVSTAHHPVQPQTLQSGLEIRLKDVR